MPGYHDWGLSRKVCPDCGGGDPGETGWFIHKPTCPTQEGHEEAQRLEDEARAESRRKMDEYAASDEAKRLRALRTIGRLADAGP